MTIKTITAAAALSIGLAASSQAALIWNSIPTGGTGEATNLGQSITTGALGLDNVLDNIQLEASAATGDADATFTATLNIYKSTDGLTTTWDAGALLATSDSASLSPTNNATFNFSGLDRITLDDSSVYLIHIVRTGGGSTRIAFSNTATGDAATGNSFNNVTGATGSLLGGGNINHDFGVAINTVSAVPEPSSTALLGLGGLALILRRRK